MTRSLRALCLVLALLLPAVAAGEGPRVLAVWPDGVDDVTFAPYAVWKATPETDVERITFAVDEEDLLIRYDVVDLSHRTTRDPNVALSFWFHARSPASGYSGVTVRAAWLPPRFGDAAGPQFAMWLYDEAGRCLSCDASGALRGDWNLTDDSVTVRLPRTLFQGDLVDTMAWSHLTLPTSANSLTSVLTLGDLVPDGVHGPDVPTA